MDELIVIGAGPAGLTGADEALRHGMRPRVLEADMQVGGISRTVRWDEDRIDIGGHRFFSKETLVQQRWQEWLGDGMQTVPRLSRILYAGRFYHYPLRFGDVLRNFGIRDCLRAGLAYLAAQLRPTRPERSFADWVSNRFGGFLYERFFRTYTEKVWGIPCTELRADWAAQRIQGLSLPVAVLASLGLRRGVRTLTDEFQYPPLGPGMLWERVAESVAERGGHLHLGCRVVALHHDGGRVQRVSYAGPGRAPVEVAAAQVLSTMPLGALVEALQPAAPAQVRAAAKALRHRDFLLVALRVARADLFPDNWLYVHDPQYQVGRIQNVGNWSAAMVGTPGHSVVVLEYFCSRGDALWEMADEALGRLARREFAALGLATADEIGAHHVIRQPDAYPVYDEHYRAHLQVIEDYLGGFSNLQTAGRSGLHRYNNQDHSMVSAIEAVRALAGNTTASPWAVNLERSYHEEQRLSATPA